MRSMLRHGRPADPFRGWTPGERGLALALAALALAGAALATGALGQIGGEAGGGPLYRLWIAAAGAAGGAAGGATALPALRRTEAGGRLWRALRGGLVATVVAALVTGTLALPLWGTMFGPFILFLTLIGKPGLAALWAAALGLLTLRARGWQAERETIFRPLR